MNSTEQIFKSEVRFRDPEALQILDLLKECRLDVEGTNDDAAALSLGGFAINGVNLTKLQSYPEKNSFSSYFFLLDLEGHIQHDKVKKSLEELGLHTLDFHVLGVYEASKFREK